MFLRAEGFRYEPDLVILNFFAGNDFGNNHVTTAAPTKARFSLENGELRLHPPARRPGLTMLRDRILAHSAIARAIRPAFNRLGFGRTLAELGLVSNDTEAAHDEATQRAMQEVTQQLILTMAREVEMRDARFFIHVIPDPIELTPYLPDGIVPEPSDREEAAHRASTKSMRQALLKFLEQERIQTVFAWDRMVEDSRAGRIAFVGGVGHWNEFGNLRAAEDLHRSVLPAVREALERNQRGDTTVGFRPSSPLSTSQAAPTARR